MPEAQLQNIFLTLADVDQEQMNIYHQLSSFSGTVKEELVPDLSLADLRAKRQSNSQLLHVAKDELNVLRSTLSIPYFIIIADQDGDAIEMLCSSGMLHFLQGKGIMPGLSFSMAKKGINAISLSIELEKPTVVRGKEHHIQLLREWNCVCVPIVLNNKNRAYIKLAFNLKYDIDFAVSVMMQVKKNIERELLSNCPSKMKEITYLCFNKYGLSMREKEAAYGWFLNHSTLRIAGDMGITEGSVRNIIKKVYTKTQVNDKGQFIWKFNSLVSHK
ncbi:helix-turn-helix transcriptional regulator [Paenibacillus sp. FJAT-27812]|uniref:helix-turn-helix transcriptional regulator n=1 Tax=Paenibacillus sp. FJAT-27812 TaxID=1684143 RepID=UPI0006A790E6|nr:hypothetical protein [Paenibacillus sp. FJAT-27812]